jgi:hypothetical protein
MTLLNTEMQVRRAARGHSKHGDDWIIPSLTHSLALGQAQTESTFRSHLQVLERPLHRPIAHLSKSRSTAELVNV